MEKGLNAPSSFHLDLDGEAPIDRPIPFPLAPVLHAKLERAHPRASKLQLVRTRRADAAAGLEALVHLFQARRRLHRPAVTGGGILGQPNGDHAARAHLYRSPIISQSQDHGNLRLSRRARVARASWHKYAQMLTAKG